MSSTQMSSICSSAVQSDWSNKTRSLTHYRLLERYRLLAFISRSEWSCRIEERVLDLERRIFNWVAVWTTRRVTKRCYKMITAQLGYNWISKLEEEGCYFNSSI